MLTDELTEEELLQLCGDGYVDESVYIEPINTDEDEMKPNVLEEIMLRRNHEMMLSD